MEKLIISGSLRRVGLRSWRWYENGAGAVAAFGVGIVGVSGEVPDYEARVGMLKGGGRGGVPFRGVLL